MEIQSKLFRLQSRIESGKESRIESRIKKNFWMEIQSQLLLLQSACSRAGPMKSGFAADFAKTSASFDQAIREFNIVISL